jgi:putative phosphoribosyl transferase
MGDITEDVRLRDLRFVFSDRHDAGRQLGALLSTVPALRDPLVLAIPAGGVPVGIEVALALNAPFSLAIVRKIRIPGTTESGFGAVTWDGEVLINEPLRAALGLSAAEVEVAVAETQENVRARLARFMGDRPAPGIRGKTIVLTDDGLASGFTMLAAIQAVRRRKPAAVIVAVPTASASAAAAVARQADRLVCVNIRTGRSFAVADAYRKWYDLDDREVGAELGSVR